MGSMWIVSPITKVYSMFIQKNMNLLHIRWSELLKDFDTSVRYNPGKANVVTNSLSRLLMGSVAHVEDEKKKLVCNVHRFARIGFQLMGFRQGWCHGP